MTKIWRNAKEKENLPISNKEACEIAASSAFVTPNTYTVAEIDASLSLTTLNAQKGVRLPKLELPKMSGDVKQWQSVGIGQCFNTLR